jgi:siderophore synthetase component
VLSDAFLRETGVIALGEVASVSVAHPAFETVADVPYQHTELLGAIWRESVESYLTEGERAISLAALLHKDPAGVAYVEPLVARSGLSVEEWVSRLHEVTLPPLLHMLYRYGAAFSPHAQNCMLVLRDDAPARLVVKDFVDDMMVSSDPLPELADMPGDVRAALGDGVEAAILVQWIQGGLLVCVHRYLAEIFDDRLGYAESSFWAAGERAVARYQARFPELEDRFALFDMQAPAFVKLCLNRVRMLERGYNDAASRPVAAAVGWIENPLAP